MAVSTIAIVVGIAGVVTSTIAVAICIVGVVIRIAEAAVVRTIVEFANFGIVTEHVAIIEVEQIAATATTATTAVVGTPGTIDSRSALAPVEVRSP